MWGRRGARVVRGGSWNNNENNLRAAYRNRNNPANENNNNGFRCARPCSMPALGRHATRSRTCSWLGARAPDVPAHPSGRIPRSAACPG